VDQECIREVGAEVYSLMNQYLEDHANMQELEECSQEFVAMQKFKEMRLINDLRLAEEMDTPSKEV
jgi:hypothetical protein